MSTPDLNLAKPYIWLATWFGCGFMKPAPGTWGSIGALPFAVIIFGFLGLWNFIAAIALVTLIGYWASKEFENETKTHDNSMIVIDEVAGQWVALIPVFLFIGLNMTYIILAFGLFRLFDILKPWPVSYFDKDIGGPAGVMGDDIIAGLYAAGCLIGLIHAGFAG